MVIETEVEKGVEAWNRGVQRDEETKQTVLNELIRSAHWIRHNVQNLPYSVSDLSYSCTGSSSSDSSTSKDRVK